MDVIDLPNRSDVKQYMPIPEETFVSGGIMLPLCIPFLFHTNCILIHIALNVGPDSWLLTQISANHVV